MRRAADQAVRGLGVLVAVVAAVALALLTAFLTPLHLGEVPLLDYRGAVRLPLAIGVAVMANWALVWFTFRATEWKPLALLPGLVWMGIMIVLSARTTEGDIVLAANNWVAVVSIFAGVGAYAVAGYRLLVPPPPPARPGPPERPGPPGPPDH